LLAAGYKLDRMAMVDLFPQTYHLETVVALRIAD
jgi:23S rRNA (uracil1939-C5)-methyltransferase